MSTGPVVELIADLSCHISWTCSVDYRATWSYITGSAVLIAEQSCHILANLVDCRGISSLVRGPVISIVVQFGMSDWNYSVDLIADQTFHIS